MATAQFGNTLGELGRNILAAEQIAASARAAGEANQTQRFGMTTNAQLAREQAIRQAQAQAIDQALRAEALRRESEDSSARLRSAEAIAELNARRALDIARLEDARSRFTSGLPYTPEQRAHLKDLARIQAGALSRQERVEQLKAAEDRKQWNAAAASTASLANQQLSAANRLKNIELQAGNKKPEIIEQAFSAAIAGIIAELRDAGQFVRYNPLSKQFEANLLPEIVVPAEPGVIAPNQQPGGSLPPGAPQAMAPQYPEPIGPVYEAPYIPRSPALADRGVPLPEMPGIHPPTSDDLLAGLLLQTQPQPKPVYGQIPEYGLMRFLGYPNRPTMPPVPIVPPLPPPLPQTPIRGRY